MSLEPEDPQRPTDAERVAAQKIVDTPVLAPFAEFPAWRYHTDGRSQLVKSEAEARALGSGWSDAPGKDYVPEPTPEAVTIQTPPPPKTPAVPARARPKK